MKIEEFVRINRLWGKSIKKVRDYYFCSQHDTGFPLPVYSTFPLNHIVEVDEQLIKSLRRKFLITQVLLDLPKKDIYEFVLSTDKYSLEQFDGKSRKGIRRSLEACSFRKPSKEDLLTEGFAINKQLSERESLKDEKLTNFKQWEAYIDTVYHARGFTFLGAFKEDRMIGYLSAFELNGKFYTNEAYIDRDHTGRISPMRGLLYVLVNDLLNDHATVNISYGFHRYLRPTNLTRFKESMQFKRLSFAKGYVVNPALLLCLRLIVFTMMKLTRRSIFKRNWARAIIRLYQGHRRLEEALMETRQTGQFYRPSRSQPITEKVLMRVSQNQ